MEWPPGTPRTGPHSGLGTSVPWASHHYCEPPHLPRVVKLLSTCCILGLGHIQDPGTADTCPPGPNPGSSPTNCQPRGSAQVTSLCLILSRMGANRNGTPAMPGLEECETRRVKARPCCAAHEAAAEPRHLHVGSSRGPYPAPTVAVGGEGVCALVHPPAHLPLGLSGSRQVAAAAPGAQDKRADQTDRPEAGAPLGPLSSLKSQLGGFGGGKTPRSQPCHPGLGQQVRGRRGCRGSGGTDGLGWGSGRGREQRGGRGEHGRVPAPPWKHRTLRAEGTAGRGGEGPSSGPSDSAAGEKGLTGAQAWEALRKQLSWGAKSHGGLSESSPGPGKWGGG